MNKKCSTCKKIHKRCSGHKKDGNPCGRNPNKDSDLCYACIKNQQNSHADKPTFLRKIYNSDSYDEDEFQDEFDKIAMRFYRAWELTYGNVSASCEYAGINRDTYYEWIKSKLPHHIAFRKKLKSIRPEERILDVAVGIIHQRIEQGDVETAKYFLDRKGGSRGYTRINPKEQLNIDEKVESIIHIIEKAVVDGEFTDFEEALEFYLENTGKKLRPEIKAKLITETEQ